MTTGDTYLQEFENNCILPVNNQWLTAMIEKTYRTAAVYYFYKGNKTKAKSYFKRGLKYVPNSRLLESAGYWGESFTQNAIGPTFVFRGENWLTAQIGLGVPLEVGPAMPDDFEQPPVMLMYSLGAYIPL